MSTTLDDVMHEMFIEQQLDLDRQVVESHIDRVMFDLHSAILFKWSGDDVKSFHQAIDYTLKERDHFYWTEDELHGHVVNLLPVAARTAYHEVRAWLEGNCLCEFDTYCSCEDLVGDVVERIDGHCWFISEVLATRQSLIRVTRLPLRDRMRSWMPSRGASNTVAAPRHRLRRLFIAAEELRWSRDSQLPDGARASLWRASIGDFVEGAYGLLSEEAEAYWGAARIALRHVLELDARNRHDLPKDDRHRADLPKPGVWTRGKTHKGFTVPDDELRLLGPGLRGMGRVSWNDIEPMQSALHDLIRCYIAFIIWAQSGSRQRLLLRSYAWSVR